MKKRRYSVYTIGAPTIIMVLIVLCIITFAALSLTSAKADNSLSVKMADNTTKYYEASTKAQSVLQKIDSKVAEIWAKTDAELFEKTVLADEELKKYGEVTMENNNVVIKYSIEYGDSNALNVVVKVVPQKEHGECTEIISYQSSKNQSWKLDDNINVYIPE